MLWVRIPPGPLARVPLLARRALEMSPWSSPECSPPCHGGGRGFKSHRGRLGFQIADFRSAISNLQSHGTVRKPAKRLSSNLGDRLWVRFPPVLLGFAGVVGNRAGCKPAAHSLGGSIPHKPTAGWTGARTPARS